MKCPKCNYLGFETGDRCKNCGYDFSLIESSGTEEIDVELTLPPAETAVPDAPLRPMEAAAPRIRAESVLPLFTPADAADDEPLIRLPAAPRPPLAVRRTPDVPRLRSVSRALPRIEPEPVLQFADEPDPPASAKPEGAVGRREDMSTAAVSGAVARLAAAAIDHVMLATIDLAVVYFTLRMAALSMADWQVLPLAPLTVFLLLLKLAYFCAFTAIGGQTIGKMAMHIRVVTDKGDAVDGACAARRTIAGLISAAVLGLGFVPALMGPDRRALHDRLARTRVIALRSA